MTQAGIELASPSLNTTDSQKFPYIKSVGQESWNGRLQHFWPKVLESAIPTLFVERKCHVKDEFPYDLYEFLFPYDLYEYVYIIVRKSAM